MPRACAYVYVIMQFRKFNDGHTILSGPGENGINADGNYTFILADYLVSASSFCREFPHTLTRLVARERKAPAEIRLARFISAALSLIGLISSPLKSPRRRIEER